VISSGQMRYLVRIERRSTTRDSTGEALRTWTLVAERRCDIERAPGHEVWASAGREQRVPTRLKLRYDQTIIDSFAVPGETRAVLSGKHLDIINCFDPDGRKAEMTLIAKEYVEVAP